MSNSDYDDTVLFETEDETEDVVEPVFQESKTEEELIEPEEMKKLKFSTENQVPYNYVVKSKDKFLNLIDLISNDNDIVYNINKLISMNFKIKPNFMINIFYFANKDKSPEYLIENFNKLKELTDREYYLEVFDGYVQKFNELFKIQYQDTEKKYKEIINFYEKVKKIESSFEVDSVLKTLNLTNSKIDYSVLNNGYKFSIDNSIDIFNNLELNSNFPLVILKLKEKKLYKLYTKINSPDYLFKLEKTVEYSENKIYLFYEFLFGNRRKNTILEINLENSIIEVLYPEEILDKLKNDLLELIPGLTFEKESKKSLEGFFEIEFDNYNELKMYYLTLFDKIFSYFIFIREDSSPRSLKENIKYHYVGSNQTRNFLNYSIYFYINKIYSNKYLIKFVSKNYSKNMIKEFILVLSKLVNYYQYAEMDNYEFITNKYTGINGLGLGGDPSNKKISKDKLKTKKIDYLINISKELFSKSLYSRNCPCPKQPIVIDPEDVEDWEVYNFDGNNRNIILFPPENSNQKVAKNYYVCPDDTFKTISLKENPDYNSEYPVIPCCNKNKFDKEVYDNYDKIRENPESFWTYKEEYKGKGKNLIKTYKILNRGRLGFVPEEILKFIKKFYNEVEFSREGTSKNSKSSLIHCMLIGTENYYPEVTNTKYKKQLNLINNVKERFLVTDIENREKLIEKLRTRFFLSFPEIKIELLLQENFDYTEDEIKILISDKNTSFESFRFYRLLEFLFNVNIFVFVFDKNTNISYFETPNHIYFHHREIRKELPSIIILNHKNDEKYNIYELIRFSTPDENSINPYLFPKEFNNYVIEYLKNSSYYKYDVKSLEIKKNFLFDINWNYILRDYEIISQLVNSAGRSYSLSFKFGDNKYMTLFFESIFPMNVHSKRSIFKAKLKDIENIFGKKYFIGSEGLWYEINHNKKGIFIPCEDIEKDYTKERNYEFEVLSVEEKVFPSTELMDYYYKLYKNSIILKQIIRWLYLLENLNFDTWFSNYVTLDQNVNKKIISRNSFDIQYLFPLEINNTLDGIYYYSDKIPEIFKENKIHLYEELYNNIYLYFKNLLRKTKGLELINSTCIQNVYNYEIDFKNFNFNKLLLDEEKYNDYKNSILGNGKDTSEIYEEDYDLENPFIWKNKETGKIYIVQNNIEHSLKISLLNTYFWKTKKINITFDTNVRNIWKYFQRDDFKLEDVYLTEDYLRNYIYEKTSKKVFFSNEKQYLEFLEKNEIEYDLNFDISYIVYEGGEGKYYIQDKKIYDNVPPVELFKYPNGYYAAMLDLV